MGNGIKHNVDLPSLNSRFCQSNLILIPHDSIKF